MSNETKHTPAPAEKWVFQKDFDTFQGYYNATVTTDEQEHIAIVQGNTKEQVISRGQLIASAPELLEACRQARLCINHHGIVGDPASFLLDAAIEKACGQ